jgi:hypothetical protein
MISNSLVADGASVQLRISAVAGQAAPTNTAALTGTALGTLKNMTAAVGGSKQGFALSFVQTGLTLNGAYWIDVGLKAVTAGTASIFDVDIVAIEL